MTNPLALPDVALLVGLVNPGGRSGRGWPSKLRMILALATFVDGGWFNGPDAELLTGIDRAYARRLLGELERQSVIIRDGGHGPRAHVFWCELNPDWRRWDVEWSMEPRQIEARLAHNRAARVRQPLERLFSRPVGSRYHRVIATLGSRANLREKADFVPFSRHLGVAIFDPPSRPQRSRKRADPAKEVSLLEAKVESSSSSDPTATAQKEEGVRHPGWGRVRSAYAAKVGVRAVFGAPADNLARLVALHGDEAVLEAIDRAPDELGVRLLAEQLPEYFGVESDELATVTSIEAEAAERARRSHLEQILATYRAEGAEPPEVLLAQLARWHDGGATDEEAGQA